MEKAIGLSSACLEVDISDSAHCLKESGLVAEPRIRKNARHAFLCSVGDMRLCSVGDGQIPSGRVAPV